jgi:hypothetical protein
MNDVPVLTRPRTYRFAPALRNFLKGTLALLAITLLFFRPSAATAVPYASGVTNNAGTVSFTLNEAAGNVTVVFDGGASSNDLGALTNGTHSFSLGGATTFSIVVKKDVPLSWTQISTDTNLTRFFSGRGVAVNMDPSTPLFGRIYVANALNGTTAVGGRVTGDGIYILNADRSDALGRGDTASTGGLNFTPAPAAQNGNSPWRIEIGPDNHLYIADFSTNFGTIYRTDPDVTLGVQVLAGKGMWAPDANTSVHTTIGGSPIVKGSIETGDLTIWAIDGALTGNLNRLMRWDIGAGPLPSSVAPVAVAVPSPLLGANANVNTDNDTGPDGKFFVLQNRANGTEVGVAVLVTNASGSGTTTVFNSLTESRSISNNPAAIDILRVSRALKVSPDGTKLAVIRDDNQTWIIPLVNGIPNLSKRLLVPTFTSATAAGRDVCWDAAGNLYVISSGTELLRVWSPGGNSTATTRSDGTFHLDVFQPAEIEAVATDALAGEAGPDTATFTLTRTGDTAEALTVNYTLSGTATNGTDYETNILSVTFASGESTATVTITPIDDDTAELVETVSLALAAGAGYTFFPATLTASIMDNESPVVNASATDANAYEPFSADKLVFRVERLGDTNLELFVVLGYAGSAIGEIDFRGLNGDFLPFDIYLAPGQVSQTVSVEPLDDLELEGDETVGLVIQPGFDYSPGTPDTAFAVIKDNELPAERVLFADSLDAETPGNWTVRFGANNGIYDADVRWGLDYTTLIPAIPPSPHSTPGSTRGLYLQVNRTNAVANGTAGINVYPGRNFSGNFALRVDMYLSYDIAPAGSTEHALLGLNHSGLYTNRTTITTGDGSTNAVGGDGVWAAIGTDASNSRDWGAYFATNATTLPGLYTNRSAASVAGLLSAPPYALAGSPGNRSASTTKTWAEVELGQIDNVITLKVNNSVVYSFLNPSGFTSGDIMIGHNDQADSIGSRTNFVIFDNVRVISLDFTITSISFVGNTVQIDFDSPLGGQAADFHLQSTGSLLDPIAWDDEDSATITALAQGFRFALPREGDTRFYRIRR